MKEYSKLHKQQIVIKEIFSDIKIILDNGKSKNVPIYWDHEDVINSKLKGEKTIFLPLMFIHDTGIELTEKESIKTPKIYYQLHIETLFQEEINQIIEECLQKFQQNDKIKLKSITNNYNVQNNYFGKTILKYSIDFYCDGLE